MNPDKSHWPRVKFGDVVHLNTNRCADPVAAGIERYVGLEHIEPKDLLIRSWGLVEEGTTFTNRFRPGQVLFGKRRAYQRKVAVADFEGICSSDIYVFEPKDDRLLPELLPFLCQTESFYEHAVGTSAGSLSPRTNWSQLANYEFTLPPLEEQRRIAKMLLVVEEAKDSYYDLRSQSAKLLDSTQEKVFRNLLETSSVPKRYLGELLAVPIANGIFRKREQFGKGIPLINVTDIYKSFRIETGELELVPVSEREYSRFSAMPNDVIFNRSSLVLAGIGYAALVPVTRHEMVFDCHLMRARPNPDLLFGPYLARFAVSIYGRQHFLSRAQTTTMTTIGQSDLAELTIPCPDLSTQIMITEQLDNTQASATWVEQRMHSLDIVKRSLLLCLEN